MDGTAREGSRPHQQDKNHHLAKVRVAGSNPVFRSIVAGQRRLFDFSTSQTAMWFTRGGVKRVRPRHHGAFAFRTFPHAAVSARSALGEASC